jgi:hypothetical protein
MVLFKLVVHVDVRSMPDRLAEFAADGRWIRIVTVARDPIWRYTGDGPRRSKEGLSGREVAVLAQHHIHQRHRDRWCDLVDVPASTDVATPTAPQVLGQSRRQLRFPHPDRLMAEPDPAEREHLGEIAKAQLVAQTPKHHERDGVAGVLCPVQQAGPGAAVFAGAIDLDGVLTVTVTRTGAATTLGRVVALMRAAERAKPPVSRLLERYAGRYLVLVLLAAAGLWFATGSTPATLALLVASCPCALVLATPATAVAAIAVAARHGILVKGSAFLEHLATVDSLVLDKAGTVTLGALRLVSALPAPGVEARELLAVAAALGAASRHPVSRAPGGGRGGAGDAGTGRGRHRVRRGRRPWASGAAGRTRHPCPATAAA